MTDIKMTAEEALALVGEATAEFSSLYKGVATYRVVTDDFKAVVYYGESTYESAYHMSIEAGDTRSVAEAIDEEASVKITRLSDSAVYEFEREMY